MSKSFIYIIGPENGPYKIGHSVNPDKRCSQLQTGRLEKIRVLYTKEIDKEIVEVIEKLIHKQLSVHKVRGEWFNLSLDDMIMEIDFAFIRWADVPNLKEKFRLNLL